MNQRCDGDDVSEMLTRQDKQRQGQTKDQKL